MLPSLIIIILWVRKGGGEITKHAGKRGNIFFCLMKKVDLGDFGTSGSCVQRGINCLLKLTAIV